MVNSTSTLPIFLTRIFGFGLPRLMLAIVTMRGVSTSATAIQTSTIGTITVMFGWCVDDSVFPFCLGCLLNCGISYAQN